MNAEFASAIEQAALIAENWVSPMRPGSDNRLLGQLETGKEIASAIRQLTTAPAAIFFASDPPPSQLPAHKSEAYAIAEAAFADYFARNYPGPDTTIFDPAWHAPKIFYAAFRVLSAPPAGDAAE
jgi:hypothetical protein